MTAPPDDRIPSNSTSSATLGACCGVFAILRAQQIPKVAATLALDIASAPVVGDEGLCDLILRLHLLKAEVGIAASIFSFKRVARARRCAPLLGPHRSPCPSSVSEVALKAASKAFRPPPPRPAAPAAIARRRR